MNSSSNKIKETEILFDLKTILSDYYVATLDLSGDCLNIRFVNGQQFAVTVREIEKLQ